MESLKHEYQIRCSHYELEFSSDDKRISCSICGKNWSFKEDRGYSKFKEIYKADIE
jgi:ribosomal protein S27E